MRSAMLICLAAALVAAAGCITVSPPDEATSTYLVGRDAFYWGAYRAGGLSREDCARLKPAMVQLRALVETDPQGQVGAIEELLTTYVPGLIAEADRPIVEQEMRDLAAQIVAKEPSEDARKTREVVLRLLDGILDGIDYALGMGGSG